MAVMECTTCAKRVVTVQEAVLYFEGHAYVAVMCPTCKSPIEMIRVESVTVEEGGDTS